MVLLGVNIDHVATLRNARGVSFPDPVRAALIAETHGADGVTAHLREDRRHIRDADMKALRANIRTRLNMEMAVTEEMLAIALDVRPEMVTLVPERREELTTEGGLDVRAMLDRLPPYVARLRENGIRVSLFIDPNAEQVTASAQSGAQIVEFHTGRYCEAFAEGSADPELAALLEAARQAVAAGLEVNAGHGLNYENVKPVLAMAGLVELNIGHSLIAESVFSGLGPAVRRMKDLIS